MPLFISDEVYEAFKFSGDAPAVAEAADAFIRNLHAELIAENEASAITSEQACSFLESKYVSLSDEYESLRSRSSQAESSLHKQALELAQAQAHNHQLHLKLIEKDGEIERLSTEVKELQKSNRQLVNLVGAKDSEIGENISTIQSYIDKITNLSDRAAQRETRLGELEAELVRCKVNSDRLSQGKELIEKHNGWLNDELTTKVDNLMQQRRRSADIEANLSSKLADMEKQYNECSTSLSRENERAKELEKKLDSLHQDLCLAKDEASAAEKRYSLEISTMSKLVDLYKQSSQEWSKKAEELDGVIKALETHLSQIEGEYKEKLEKEGAVQQETKKESIELKEKLSKYEVELEASRKANELALFPLSNITAEALLQTADTNYVAGDSHAIVPHVPAGISGTALAASLLRDGWSLAKMYAKYQEAADAFRHEQLGRKQAEACLERVFIEIEDKASLILDERAEHERMAEAYALMNQKVQQSLSEQANLEKVIGELKADLRRRECECDYSQKEISDLQKQVTILLKESRDIQLRCGSVSHEYLDDYVDAAMIDNGEESDAQKVISEHLLSIKDVKGLVEQNAKLRRLVRSLSDDIGNKDRQLKEQFEEELLKLKEDASSKVSAVLERAEEQGKMIESLHSAVAMYRRLYEEELKLRSSQPQVAGTPSTDSRKDVMLLLEGSQEASKRVQEQASERIRGLKEELGKRKSEIISLRSDRDKLALEADFVREKLERFMKEFDHQRDEVNKVLARNIEFSHLILDYQKKLRESSESLQSAEELSRKLNRELSVLKLEKELFLNSEKRAYDEVQDMTQRLYRLQATLDTIQSAEQVREEARVASRRKHEEYIKKIEREWAEAKKELLEERNSVRTLTLDHENSIKDGMRQVENMGKELAAALQAVATAESRAAVAESRCSDLESNLKSSEPVVVENDGALKPSPSSNSEVVGDLRIAKQENERLKAEVQAIKDHMLQYKSIAEVNEDALKQIKGAHENFKVEMETLKNSLETEIESLMAQVHEVENKSSLKFKEVAAAASQKEEALAFALAEITSLKQETLIKVSQIAALEVQVTAFKEDLEREHQRARSAQANYESQVILQAETIQELTKTSQALGSFQEEAYALQKTLDAYKSENTELKAKWYSEKSDLEKSKSEAERKCYELNEQNKILHSQLEAVHIKVADNDRDAYGLNSTSTSIESTSESGLHGVVSYLRRSKEIAETEISLLKQEKLRLQSQLDRALKAAEIAEALLSEERANSRKILFSEDEYKALKHQMSGMNLLRESNTQLREENSHNFEECQKLRKVAQNMKLEVENLQNLLREKEIEANAFRKEIELQRKEKEQMERRLFETLEKANDVDIEESSRLKGEIEQMQASVREKDAAAEEMRKHVSEKEEVISKLEQDLASTKSELTEKENRLSQVEANLESGKERQKRFGAQMKRRVDSLAREKESLLKDKESLTKEKDNLLKEKESSAKEKEELSKEKHTISKQLEELSKEKHTISKQLEELSNEKILMVDIPIDPAMREKDKEKDARIQILENTVGRLREDNRKEKEKRQGIEKVIQIKAKNINQEKQKFEDEHGKYKEALRKISDEFEKLKHARDSLPEGTAVIQILSGNNMDDLALGYVRAVENFEREAHSVTINIGNASAMDTTNAAASSTEMMPSHVQSKSSSYIAPPTCPPVKVADERGISLSLPKTVVETRKAGRKLVRPRLVKPQELQRDIEMLELGGSKSTGKMQETAMQSSVPVLTETPIVRKRPASPEESNQPEDSSTGTVVPVLKRSKGSVPAPEDVQGTSSAQVNDETVPTVEELLDIAFDMPQGLTEEGTNFIRDQFETGQEPGKEIGEQQVDEKNQGDLQTNYYIIDEEHHGKPNEEDTTMNEGLNSQAEQDFQQAIVYASEKEGELPPERSDVAMNTVNEIQLEQFVPSPARMDDESNEINSSEISDVDEHNECDIVEDVGEGSDKSAEGSNQIVGNSTVPCNEVAEVAEGNISASGDSTISKDALSTPSATISPDATHVPRVGGSLRTINLTERAKERAAARLGLSPASTSSASVPRRGRGGQLARGRGGRVHGERRQASGDS